MVRTLYAVIGLSWAASVYSQEAASAPTQQMQIRMFELATSGRPNLCLIKLETADLNIISKVPGASYKEVNDCIEDAKRKAEEAFPAVRESVKGKPEAERLLKDFYAAWLTAIDAVTPGVVGSISRAKQEAIAADRKAKEIWTRFKIESRF